ncbi:ATP-binding cassette domain-containing protein [Cryobacterium breve]|uniref:ATP-binding cassette domain-containing protein n=1 Tax=Cryobacterium breve TaxID=1259258 RepID=A0ABY7NHV0_9MICO|nr:ATP-binding cassette domain-containing protein [Cryobacterium breve]
MSTDLGLAAAPTAAAAAATASVATVATVPGVPKPDPILVVDNIVRQFGGMTAVNVPHLEVQRGIITALIGPNGAGKTTFFNLITGFDKPELRSAPRGRPQGRTRFPCGVQRTFGQQHGCGEGRPARHGAHLPADQGTEQAHGAREHAPRRKGPAGRESLRRGDQAALGGARTGDHGASRGPPAALQAAREEERHGRQPLRRPEEAPRNGAGAHERTDHDHAR